MRYGDKDVLPAVIMIAANLRLLIPIVEKGGDVLTYLLQMALDECDRILKGELPIPEMDDGKIRELERQLASMLKH